MGAVAKVSTPLLSAAHQIYLYGARYEPSAFQTSPTNTSFWGPLSPKLFQGSPPLVFLAQTDSTTEAMWKIHAWNLPLLPRRKPSLCPAFRIGGLSDMIFHIAFPVVDRLRQKIPEAVTPGITSATVAPQKLVFVGDV